MLTREDFMKLFANRLENAGALNQAYTEGTPDEQNQYIAWMEELNPIEDEPVQDERNILAQAGEVLADTSELERAIHERENTTEIEARIHAERRPITPAVTRQSIMARQRAYRSNMLRKLKRSFRLMQMFDSQTASLETGVNVEAVARYLATESHVIGGQIGYNPEFKKYYIVDPLM